MNKAGHYVGAEGTSMQCRRTLLAVILYCGLIVMLWLLPTLARGSARPFGRAFIGPSHAIVRTVAEAVGEPEVMQNPVTRGIGSVIVLAVLGLPFLGALLSKSSLVVRFVLLSVGVVIGMTYLWLAVLSFYFGSSPKELLHFGRY